MESHAEFQDACYLSLDLYGTLVRFKDLGNEFQEGTLTASVAPEDCNYIPSSDFKVYAVEYGVLSLPLLLRLPGLLLLHLDPCPCRRRS